MHTKEYEVEVKYHLKGSLAQFQKKLQSLGFELKLKSNEVDTYYSRPDVDFIQTVECLRVRRRENFCELTYKPPTTKKSVDGYTAKKETNVRLSSEQDEAVAKEFLQNIGMVQVAIVDKHRMVYVCPAMRGISVVIDALKDVGTYVELEAMSEDVEAARSELTRLAATLELSKDSVVGVPYRDMVLQASLLHT